MGWTARQVDDLSLWELSAAIDGWNLANGGEPPIEAMSAAEFDDLIARNERWIISSGTKTKQ